MGGLFFAVASVAVAVAGGGRGGGVRACLLVCVCVGLLAGAFGGVPYLRVGGRGM